MYVNIMKMLAMSNDCTYLYIDIDNDKGNDAIPLNIVQT